MAILQGSNVAEIHALKQEIDRFFDDIYPTQMQEYRAENIFPLVEMKQP